MACWPMSLAGYFQTVLGQHTAVRHSTPDTRHSTPGIRHQRLQLDTPRSMLVPIPTVLGSAPAGPKLKLNLAGPHPPALCPLPSSADIKSGQSRLAVAAGSAPPHTFGSHCNCHSRTMMRVRQLSDACPARTIDHHSGPGKDDESDLYPGEASSVSGGLGGRTLCAAPASTPLSQQHGIHVVQPGVTSRLPARTAACQKRDWLQGTSPGP